MKYLYLSLKAVQRVKAFFFFVAICTFNLLFIFFFGATASASEVKWSSEPYSLYAKGDKLRKVLTDLAAGEGIPVEVEDSIQDMISVRFEEVTRQQIFHGLVDAYGLAWYYDGYRLYIDRLENTKSGTIKLNNVSTLVFKRYLEKLGFAGSEKRFYWRTLDDRGLIYLSGPQAFIDHITEMASTLDDRSKSVDTIYKWVDEKGRTHMSTDESEAPQHSDIIEIQRGASRRLPAHTSHLTGDQSGESAAALTSVSRPATVLDHRSNARD
ncbi:hypothetical protein FKG94_22580 [Exilibacterium tricleocarpae]|uniref:DUF4124 domain-containing protein n=1 Tax=Exilibacterium tricleocarpae TaxID=2591008 RepID=A0A545SYA8_9GAMM|nr:DUF4124 domain-containing protein [Exilibacterium tricleocarpae]TQV69941.1 hypothetical protein FKG94_22580 [Exilibacterium tricleocarpae]